jgi:hypothetical protein
MRLQGKDLLEQETGHRELPPARLECEEAMRSHMLLLLVVAAAGCSKGMNEPTTGERIAQLEQQRQASAAALAAYVPRVPGSIEDLAAPAAAILRQLPGVGDVEVLVACCMLTHRIIHLVLAGEVEVLPLDEQEALDRAKPGKVSMDPAKLEARHDAQVQAALADGRCSLLVLGGSHDLSVAIDKLSAGGVEYLRVTTSRFKEVSNH